MKNLILGIVTITTLLFSCTPNNPNPNGNGGQTYTQGTPVTDIDGNTYPTIISDCGQTWTAKNLNVSKYRNGDEIPQVTDPTQWSNLTTGAWCYYENNSAYGITYGKLYNWYAVNDPRGLAPVGYHVFSDVEWTTLETCLGGQAVAGGKLKETGFAHWISPNIGGSNISGFSGLPGGCVDGVGRFSSIGYFGYWWSSLEYNSTFAWFRLLYNTNSEVSRVNSTKRLGFSVRCIKN